MLRDKSNKRDRIRSNLLAILSKSGTAMAVPAVPIATALMLTMIYIRIVYIMCTYQSP